MPSFSSIRKAMLLCLESKVKPNSFEDGARNGAERRQRGLRGQVSHSSIPALQSNNVDGPDPPGAFFLHLLTFHPFVMFSWASSLLWRLLPSYACLKSARFVKLSNSDLFFSTVFSLFDLFLFKLYNVMFYTIIDNKIALEPFLTVPFFWSITSKWQMLRDLSQRNEIVHLGKEGALLLLPR